MTDAEELEAALAIAFRWSEIRTEESFGPQGKNMGTLSRALLKLRDRALRPEVREQEALLIPRLTLAGWHDALSNHREETDIESNQWTNEGVVEVDDAILALLRSTGPQEGSTNAKNS